LLFQFEEANQVSKHSLNCLEDCVLVVADLESEQIMYEQYAELQFIRFSPEERYKAIIGNRADILKRVPQHQLASYLGITPEKNEYNKFFPNIYSS
jgi:hypothetical protein